MQPDVLIVDDDEAIRDLLTGLLNDEGYFVRSAGDAYQAMEEVLASTPGLLLLDLMMPGVSGAELLARLRRDTRWEHLPVILISAHPRLREVALEVQAGAALAKPFDVGTLLAHIGRVLGPPIRPPAAAAQPAPD